MMMMMYMFPHTQLNIIRSIENIKIVFINIILIIFLQVLEQEMTRSVAKYREENKLTKQFWDWIQVFQAPVLVCVKIGFWSPSSAGCTDLVLPRSLFDAIYNFWV